MKEKITMVQDLIEKAEGYAKTTIQLYKLRAIDKGADLFAGIVSTLLIVIFGILMLIVLSIALGFYAGKLLGETHYGFFAVTGLYILIIACIMLFKKGIKNIFGNLFVQQIFKKKDHANAHANPNG